MAATTPTDNAKKAAARKHERIQAWKRVYKNWDPEGAHKLVWETEPWLDTFAAASRSKDGDSLRALRCIVQDGTRRACTPDEKGEFGYILPSGERLVYCTSKQTVIDQIASHKMHTFSWQFNWKEDLPALETKHETVFEVVEGDCLEAAATLIAKGLRPVVLNMASDHVPGGGYKGGSGAQEENLFRRTNLLRVLANEDRWYDPRGKSEVAPNKLYPLPDPSAIYSPSAFVLRGTEADGYPWLEKPYEVAFIASAAYRRPRLEKGEQRLISKMAEGFAQKVRGLLWTCAHYGHDSAVLSAWGCGAFRNPPGHIAQIFKEVLQEDWLQGRFKHITFAIFDDHNARKEHNPEGNVKPFIKVFQSAPTTKTTAAASSAASSSQQASSSQVASSSSSPSAPEAAPSANSSSTEAPAS